MAGRQEWSRRSLVALAAATASAVDVGGLAAGRIGEVVSGRSAGAIPGAVDVEGSADHLGPSIFDVSRAPFNVVADGVTDWSAVLASAATAVSRAGGGVVLLPAGEMMVENLPCYSRVAWEGRGMGVTVLKLKPGSTGHVFVTEDFARLTGTSEQAGPVNWAVRHLTIDGNRDACPAGGNGIAAFGYECFISDVLVRRCHGTGIFLEFHDYSKYEYSETLMESYLDRVKVMDCDGDGFRIDGAHDSYVTGCIAARNGFQGRSNFRVSGSHINFVGCHAWGAAAYGWLIEGEAYLHGCQGEGATIADFAIAGDDVQIVGGRCYWPEQGGPVVSTGILVGTATRKANNLQIRGMVVNRGSADDPVDFASGLDVTNAGTGCFFDLSVAQTSGSAVTGGFPPDAFVQLRVNSGGGWRTVRQE